MTGTAPSVDADRGAFGIYDFVATLLILSAAAVNVWFLVHHCPFDLAGDEAHYWEWSRRLDWSYYSKGPLVAFIIALGRSVLADVSVRWVGSEMLAVRLPAVVLSTLTAAGLFLLVRHAFSSPRLGLLAVLLAMTVPICVAGSFLMTIDAPLICAWTWALLCIDRALVRHRLWLWVLSGILIALGILAKYTMVLVYPTVALLALRSPAARARLCRLGPALAASIGVVGFVPILYWNARHDWVSLRHVAGQAGLSGTVSFNVLSPVEYLMGQAGVISPVWFVCMLLALRAWWRAPAPRPGEGHRLESLALVACAAVVPWGTFLAFSLVTKIQPNWPAMSLIPAIALTPPWLSRLADSGCARARRRCRWTVASGTLIGVGMVVVALGMDRLASVLNALTRDAPVWDLTPATRYDPTARLRGWSKLAAIEKVLQQARQSGARPFLMTDNYQVASEIAFYCPSHPPVYCVQSALGQRRNQYDVWDNPLRNPQDFIGRPCLYVGRLRRSLYENDNGPTAPLPGLRKILTIEHYVDGLRYQIWPVYYCDAFAGFSNERKDAASY